MAHNEDNLPEETASGPGKPDSEQEAQLRPLWQPVELNPHPQPGEVHNPPADRGAESLPQSASQESVELPKPPPHMTPPALRTNDAIVPKPTEENSVNRYPKAPPTIPLNQRRPAPAPSPSAQPQRSPEPPKSQPVVRSRPPQTVFTPPPGSAVDSSSHARSGTPYPQRVSPVSKPPDEDTQPIPVIKSSRTRIPSNNSRQPPPPPKKPTPEVNWSSLFLSLTLIGVGLFFIALVGLAFGYIYLAAQLPSPEELRARQPNFASSQIYDRNGKLLHEIIDPDAGKRTYVPINRVARYLQQATVATEDRNFYSHSGFDPIAIGRAIFYALQEREIVSGASTITQQVARNILLGPEAALDISASRKIKEIILAAELTRRYSKDEIMEIYVNNNNYGNLSYGIDAAARTYFGTNAADLSLAQASFLAGIPQSPAVYDPYRGGRDAALKRHKVVLSLMVEDGYITMDQAIQAAAEMDNCEFVPVFTDRIPAPHFVVYVTQWVEDNLGTEALYTGRGLRIYTTLDPRIQQIAEEEVKVGIAALADKNATNGALVAIEPSSGHILAMVGSIDFYDSELGGQVNVIQRCRQPGSAIKPLTYLAALEKGWTPATIVWDLPVTYTDTAGNVYKPVNYDGLTRGPTSVRMALANSLNISAVKALEVVTVDGLLEMADRLGADSLVAPQQWCPDYPYETRPLYGLALTLGSGEMKPLELTGAYATLANGGLRMAPTPILYVEDQSGEVLVDNRQRAGEQVVKSELAYLITSILSDTRARCMVFACPSVLELPDRPVAAKTGSTNDNRDAWTVGYTPDIAIGVWVGNNDNTPMNNVIGSSGAGPIWNAVMRRVHEGQPAQPFPRPAGIVEREICTLSGTQPSPYCPETRVDLFAFDNLPPESDQDWLQQVDIDADSGLLANRHCPENVISQIVVLPERVSDPQGRTWLRDWAAQRGIIVAPKDPCNPLDVPPEIAISAPSNREEVYESIHILGTVALANFDRYELTYGIGANPQGWGWISGPHRTMVRNGLLGTWDISPDVGAGLFTIRVVAYNTYGTRFSATSQITILAPTATPTPTPTETPT
ncbi:MAG: transglycosylase domain-containing protein, partial [Anaerolineae bacterium]|nr:transglycosylase domain-containing protein [Anaerolineae bacterium]